MVKLDEKNGYEHFMLKEIHEQPATVNRTLNGRIENNKVTFQDFEISLETAKKWNKVYIVACGTAYHAGLVGKKLFEKLLKMPVEVDIASEFAFREPLVDEKTLVIVVTQSGETTDTLEALREAKSKGADVMAITNVVDSTIARESDYVIYIWAGSEVAIPSTKAYTAMLIAEYLLVLYLGQIKGIIDEETSAKIIKELQQLPKEIEKILAEVDKFEKIAQEFKDKENVFFIGRGFDWAIALEGALKLKETSYIHAEAYPSGEFKHGTTALVNEGTLIIAVCTQKSIYDKTLANIKEFSERGAKVVAIGVEGDTELAKYTEEVIYIPEVDNLLLPALAVMPLQLIAYYISKAKGCEIDQPRNLTKAVIG
ncbi:glucosamine--fructose-6-phosphate aminotransferase (isomerizing) [Desulfonispora thiosulfatigenes DSM 11270]|uniref:Glutamine--fructose-6-phosphate aminotransferase [isomerizing] n=1 Tax=Desulfonispora thiosulfatigenes DSM 11270 TaxID=656914 RepID=A0A1W1UQJ5_DESTI|nr:glutamine--fructose-6-phosphate transaminase (isomerizing) [Desulfonispora thiosulfatigenes]SMB82974.1 glucosamine--fructose-6-phosphate aminotransferase (isomerizing) [Desulfonispora thiosulfatigenes DSM 11270]